MRIEYNRLFEKLKANNIMQKTLLEKTNISGSIMQKLRKNETVTTETIGKICEYLQCQPNDIMEIIFTNVEYESVNAEKLAIEAQIAELQAKLKQM